MAVHAVGRGRATSLAGHLCGKLAKLLTQKRRVLPCFLGHACDDFGRPFKRQLWPKNQRLALRGKGLGAAVRAVVRLSFGESNVSASIYIGRMWKGAAVACDLGAIDASRSDSPRASLPVLVT